MFSFAHLQPIRWIKYASAIALLVVLMNVPVLAQTITVTSPIGTETWYKGTQYDITWTSVSVTGRVKITLRDASSEVLVINNNTANDGTDPWTVPGTLTDGDYYVRVESRNDPSIYDDSDSTFTISTQPSITVTSPDGGETWEVGSTQSITWTSEGSVGDVKIEYSTDNGSSWLDVITSTSNSGSSSWTIPNNPSTNCLVKVSETDDDPSDTSDAVFTIATPPSITVTVPNGGENWEVGSDQIITWTSVGAVSKVKIEYSTDNGSSWKNIKTSANNTGSYSWTIPDDPSTECLVKVSETDGDPSDTSDAVFIIATPPSITVTSPVGGEIWYKNVQYDITWTSENVTGNVKITLRDASSELLVISNNTANDGTDPWTVPGTLTDGDYYVRVESRNDPNIYDDSDSTFEIAVQPSITVTSPDGGEIWEVGSTQTIIWTSTGTVDKVKIEYSTDNGSSWKNIKASANNTGSYSWTIPDDPSTECLVKVSETDGDPSDTSDATFSIIAIIGHLNVVINPQEAIGSGAQWKLTSEDNWHESGDTVSYSPSDDYTLEFKSILGWSKPSDKSIKIKIGQTTYESGTYEKIFFVTNKEIVTIPEGNEDTLKIKLSAEPSSEVLVTVSKTDGDEHITVISGSELTFTPDDWNKFQTVNLAAEEDDDVENGQATILISAPGIDDKEIIAVEEDNDGELRFVIDKRRVTVPEGETETFKVKLSGKPLYYVVVTISMADNGDPDITLIPDADTLQLTFTPDDWNKFQTVTLAAAEDDDVIDGEAIIQIRAAGIEDEDITAVEQDNDIADISLKLNPHTGTTGNIIKISIDISNNTLPISSFGLNFNYDSTLFSLKSIKKGSLTSDWSMIGGDEETTGTIIIGGVTGGGRSIEKRSDGTLVRIWLKVRCESLPSEIESPVMIENYLDDIAGFSPEPCTANITLVPCSRVGDVNGDGDVTPGDAQNTLEIYLGKRAPEFCQKTTSDSNGDESTTPGDAQDIFECYLGKREIPECHDDGSTGTSSAASFASLRKIRDKKSLRPSKPKLYPLNTIGYSGKTVNIPIIITNPEGISSFSFDVNYLPELLEYTGIRRSQLTNEFDYVRGIEEIEGLVRVEGESKQPITYNKYASLAVLVFRVKEGVNGSLPIIVFNTGKDLFNVEIDDGTFLGLEYVDEQQRFLSLGKAIIMPDMTLRIPVEVSSAFNIKSFGLELKYPSEKMLFAGINRGELVKNFTSVEGNELEPGVVRLGGYSMSGIQERKPGMLVEIVFLIKEAEGEIEIVKLVDDIQDFIIHKRRIIMNEKRDREKKLWFLKLYDHR